MSRAPRDIDRERSRSPVFYVEFLKGAKDQIDSGKLQLPPSFVIPEVRLSSIHFGTQELGELVFRGLTGATIHVWVARAMIVMRHFDPDRKVDLLVRFDDDRKLLILDHLP